MCQIEFRSRRSRGLRLSFGQGRCGVELGCLRIEQSRLRAEYADGSILRRIGLRRGLRCLRVEQRRLSRQSGGLQRQSRVNLRGRICITRVN